MSEFIQFLATLAVLHWTIWRIGWIAPGWFETKGLIHPILKNRPMQNSKEFNKCGPPPPQNSSDDLCLFFWIYPSSIGGATSNSHARWRLLPKKDHFSEVKRGERGDKGSSCHSTMSPWSLQYMNVRSFAPLIASPIFLNSQLCATHHIANIILNSQLRVTHHQAYIFYNSQRHATHHAWPTYFKIWSFT